MGFEIRDLGLKAYGKRRVAAALCFVLSSMGISACTGQNFQVRISQAPTPPPTPQISSPIQPRISPSPSPSGPPIVDGRVANAATDASIPGATVSLVLVDSNGVRRVHATTLSDQAGNYRFDMTGISENYTLLASASGFIDFVHPVVYPPLPNSVLGPYDLPLSPVLGAGQFRFVLTWSSEKVDAETDVDSWLVGPNVFINFTQKSNNGAMLDWDDVDWLGPETVTIFSPQVGEYRYLVVPFTTCTASPPAYALANSEVKVVAYEGSLEIGRFSIPPGPVTGASGQVFEFFKLYVNKDSLGNVSYLLTPVMQFSDGGASVRGQRGNNCP